jgi:hypothetical protein
VNWRVSIFWPYDVDGLSRVPGDRSARFCGEGVIAISSPYPTSYQAAPRKDKGFRGEEGEGFWAVRSNWARRRRVLRFADLLEKVLVEGITQTEMMLPEGIKVGLDGVDDTLEFGFAQHAEASQE